MPAVPQLAGLDAVRAAFPHEGVARELVVALKFRRLLPVAGLIAELVAQRAPAGLLTGTLVPVPVPAARLRRRGFDPAEEIAMRLAQLTGMACGHCLRRADGGRQVGRSRAQRIAQPPMVRASDRAPADAVLVDDVLTTGATLTACARALRAAGAETVSAITFARALE